MNKDITKKQAMYLLLICLIGTKFQRLPSFLSDIAGKSFWVVLFIYMLIDGFFLLMTLKVIDLGGGASLYEVLEKTAGKVLSKVIFFVLGVYFLVLAILPYESVHEVFADIIFDSLPWKYFAFFLLASMAVIAVSGLRNIGRLCQMMFFISAIGIVGLCALGVADADYSALLPVTETVVQSVFDGVYKSTLWFGNFTILYVLMGRIKHDEKNRWGGIKLAFFISSIFVAFAFATFYGVYEFVSPIKRNWLTKVSQFALLSLDIGRLDWFLILFGEIATILTAGIFVYCSALSFKEVFGVKKINIIIYVLLLVLYLNTNFFAKSKLDIFRVLITIGPILGGVVQYVLPVLFVWLSRRYSKTSDKNHSLLKFKDGKRKKEKEAQA